MKIMPGELQIVHGVDYPANIANSGKVTCTHLEEYGSWMASSIHVLGVALADERFPSSGGQATVVDTQHLVLGVIVLDVPNIKIEELRRIMCLQLPSLPASFCLLTKEGWPVQKSLEHTIQLHYVVNEHNIIMIKTHFEQLRVGIITGSGECIGFIFIDPNWNVSQVRNSLNEQLKEVRKHAKWDYKFLERNGWPLTLFQEHIMLALDIIRFNNHIYIQYGSKNDLTPSTVPELPVLPVTVPTSTNISTSSNIPKDKNPYISNPGQRKLSWKRPLDSLRRRRDTNHHCKVKGDLVAKPILISYVRAEASQHALTLKTGLENCGFSVYLDVHEIKTGSDWQDALNYAVSNCRFFVPLITPMYGKTQWTNREVKLADVLDKNIIPISFLDKWPPECLAIQFASTQYIPWKPKDSEHAQSKHINPESDTTDIGQWDPIYTKRVCLEIAERCKAADKGYKSRKNAAFRHNEGLNSVDSEASYRIQESQLVVISAHPKQKVLVHQLKIALESENYNVWCSSENQDYQEPSLVDEVYSSNCNTPRELTSIPEGTIFAQAYKDIANSISDSKRQSPVKMDLENPLEKRRLTRLISQASDISQVSSLAPDKIDRLRIFQLKVDQAGVVIIVASEDYTQSTTSQQQVFYCEHRKQVVLVKFDQSTLPSWFLMLMGNEMITNVQSAQFLPTLKRRVKRAMNPSSSETPKDATTEAKIQFLVKFMRENLPRSETCVYIAGSSKLQSFRSEQISRAIGKELARIKNITICTGGFHGAPEIVAQEFYSSIENNPDHLTSTLLEDSVVHFLPFKDSKDFSSKASQNADGSFEAVPFGRTVFLGESVKERETAVARLFDTCIVIEGGPGAAHEVEEFIWNDHFVIPIISTGGASSGQYGVPLKIFTAPPCVCKSDWEVLSEKEAQPEKVAKAVVNIIVAVKQSIARHNNCSIDQTKDMTKVLQKKQAKTRNPKMQSKDRNQNGTKKFDIVCHQNSETTREHKLLQRQQATYSGMPSYQYASKWQRFLRILSAMKKK